LGNINVTGVDLKIHLTLCYIYDPLNINEGKPMSDDFNDALNMEIINAKLKRKELDPEAKARMTEATNARKLFSAISDDCNKLRDVLIKRVEGIRVDVLPRNLKIYCGQRNNRDYFMIDLWIIVHNDMSYGAFNVSTESEVRSLQPQEEQFENGKDALNHIVQLIGDYLVVRPDKQLQSDVEKSHN
jgi:hypothetical protein